MEGEERKMNWESGRERKREVTATVWWSLTHEFSLRSREAVEDEADTQAGLCVQVPPNCPAPFHPPSTPTLPPPAPPAIHQSGHKGAAAQWGYIKAFSRWEAQGWCWHNTEEHRRKRGRPVRKKESKWNGKKESNQNKTFHSLHKPALCQPSIPKNPDTFFSLPWANGPLEYMNKGDNLIKKIQSSSLKEQS